MDGDDRSQPGAGIAAENYLLVIVEFRMVVHCLLNASLSLRSLILALEGQHIGGYNRDELHLLRGYIRCGPFFFSPFKRRRHMSSLEK